MRVLILGGTGLTGPFVVRRLHEQGHEVIVYHRGQHVIELPNAVRRYRGDFLNFPRELREPAPEVVVHMWADTEAAARAFLGAFRGAAGRAVVISSGDVYRAYGRLRRKESGPPDPPPLTEGAPLRDSRYPYDTDYDKILVEQTLTNQTDLPVTLLRFPAVYGPNDGHRLKRWIEPMLRGAPELRLQDDFGHWRWTHGYCEDVAEAVVLAATRPEAAGQVYNVGELETPTMSERFAAYGRVAGWKGRLSLVPAAELPEADRWPLDFAHHLIYDTTRIRSELGYAERVPLEEATARTVEWERSLLQ